jgi:hypothetical protein
MATELREALSQIAEIRQQMARAEVFRGYRSLPVAFSGGLAWLAAAAQAAWIPEPTRDLPAYLSLWITAAAGGILAAGVEMTLRAMRSSRWSREATWMAVEQFLPSIAAGGLLTIVVVRRAEESAWMLPGLWAILFSLGIFASRRLLPRAITGVALYYLAAGLLCLGLAQGAWALSPWAMGLTFGGGQMIAAVVLYQTLERPHGDD